MAKKSTKVPTTATKAKEAARAAARTIVSPEASPINQRTEIETESKLQTAVADLESPAHAAALRRQELRQRFITLSDQIAESTLFFRNYKYRGADQLFPKDIEFDWRVVTKAYPNAKGGLLLVDEPRNEYEMLIAYEKQKTLKKQGFRHIVIEGDATLEDLLQQLGEL